MADIRGRHARGLWQDAITIRREWLGHALSTEPADRRTAEDSLTAIYARISRPPPRFAWVSSPAQALPRLAGLPTLDDLYALVRDPRPRCTPPLASDLALAAAQLRAALSTALAHTDPELSPPRKGKGKEGEPWPDGPPDRQLAAGVPIGVLLHRGIRTALQTSLAAGFRAPVRAALGDCLPNGLGAPAQAALGDSPPAGSRTPARATLGDSPPDRTRTPARAPLNGRVPVCWHGQHDAAWVAYYDALHRLGLARYGPGDLDHLGTWAALARSCGWWWPGEDVCVVTDRPAVIVTEPVPGAWHEEVRLAGDGVRYRDGWHLRAGPADARLGLVSAAS